MRIVSKVVALGIGLTLSVTALSETACAAKYSILYAFRGGGDGAGPAADLIRVGNTIYGTTNNGGAYGTSGGTVFELTQSGAETVLHSFGGSGDGARPEAGLLNVGGTLYGTTSGGGAHDYGTIFSITQSGTETILHSFDGSDGSDPVAGLVRIGNTLFGTTAAGGTRNEGTVFAMSLQGSVSVLHTFLNESDGAAPRSGLIAVGGVLYGTTSGGGTYGLGTVFSITTSGMETILHAFKGGSFESGADGAMPLGKLINIDDVFYGTTDQGGFNNTGTLFAVNLGSSEAVLHSFGGGTDGYNPEASLTHFGKALFGTTPQGGSDGDGTVFKMDIGGAEKVLHNFSSRVFGAGRDGFYPAAGLLNVNRSLLGTTSTGGPYNYGTVFAIAP